MIVYIVYVEYENQKIDTLGSAVSTFWETQIVVSAVKITVKKVKKLIPEEGYRLSRAIITKMYSIFA